MKALVLAGGKGTRLANITHNEIPKPMALMCGKPILEYIIQNLKDNGISDIYLSVGHLHEKIIEYFGDGTRYGVHLQYIIEDQPLGSGGALYYLKNKINDSLFICPGDVIFDIDISRMLAYHKDKGGLITLFVHPNIHPYDSDLIIEDENGRVTELNDKNSERNFYYKNNVNAGILIIEPETLSYFTELKKVNMEHDFVNSFIPLNVVYAYNSPEYIKDIGTKERFELTEKDLKSGLVQAKNLKNKQKAIFLDRDGTINIYKNFIRSVEDIELCPTASEAIKKINKSGYLTIIVSNQPVISRGEASFEEVELMFKKIETLLGHEGCYIDKYYYCPHHPHSGFEGEVKSLKIDCDCRKPKLGLLNKAVKDFNLDLSKCILIGDTDRDMMTAQNAGIKGIKIKSDANEKDWEAETLLDAVNKILG